MKNNIWLRLLICILGITSIFGLLLHGNLTTPRIREKSGGSVNLDSLGNDLYLLEDCWTIQNEEGEIIYSTELTFSGSQQKYGLYLPRGSNARLLINGESDDVFNDENQLIYLFEPLYKTAPLSIEIRLPINAGDENSIANLYIGSYTSIINARNRESNFRLFIVGLSFAILLYSLSLYFQKPSEKYLLSLAALVYSTLGYIVLNTFPLLKSHFWINLLLLGTLQIPFLSTLASQHVHSIIFPLLVAILNFILLRNFVSVNIGKVPYIFIILPVSITLLFLIEEKSFSILHQAHFIFINIVELIIIIKGTYRNKKESIILISGCIGTVAFRCFTAACGMQLLPHGNVDLLFRLGGVTVSFYAIAFTIVINGIFAQKFSEAEVLAEKLQHINLDLQKIVDERVHELKQAYERLEKEQQQKDMFVTNMVHDLKTPLFSLGGYTDMARVALHKNPNRVEHFLDLINANLDYVGTMVNNLFLALRLEYGRVSFMQESVNLTALLKQVHDTTRIQSEAKNIVLLIEMPEKPVLVDGDIYYLTQAIQNIADNAVRHTPSGGCIRLALQELDDSILITINDNGEGIPEHILPHIFERYYSYISGKAASSGLGLSIAQDIVAAHNGRIGVASKSGTGTEFSIYLPNEN